MAGAANGCGELGATRVADADSEADGAAAGPSGSIVWLAARFFVDRAGPIAAAFGRGFCREARRGAGSDPRISARYPASDLTGIAGEGNGWLSEVPSAVRATTSVPGSLVVRRRGIRRPIKVVARAGAVLGAGSADSGALAAVSAAEVESDPRWSGCTASPSGVRSGGRSGAATGPSRACDGRGNSGAGSARGIVLSTRARNCGTGGGTGGSGNRSSGEAGSGTTSIAGRSIKSAWGSGGGRATAGAGATTGSGDRFSCVSSSFTRSLRPSGGAASTATLEL
jgi:hypothetical protein